MFRKDSILIASYIGYQSTRLKGKILIHSKEKYTLRIVVMAIFFRTFERTKSGRKSLNS